MNYDSVEKIRLWAEIICVLFCITIVGIPAGLCCKALMMGFADLIETNREIAKGGMHKSSLNSQATHQSSFQVQSKSSAVASVPNVSENKLEQIFFETLCRNAYLSRNDTENALSIFSSAYANNYDCGAVILTDKQDKLYYDVLSSYQKENIELTAQLCNAIKYTLKNI